MDLKSIFIAVPVLALSIAFHEMTHALVSDSLGDDTARIQGRLTLNPFAHINLVTTVLLPLGLMLMGLPPFGAARPVPFNPRRIKFDEFGVALVAVAGPLSNLVLAVAAGFLYRNFSGGLAGDILAVVLQINIAFFVFNLIPFPPLDGSRVLYALAPEPVQHLMEQIEGMGFTAIIVFMLVIFPLLQPAFTTIFNSLIRLLT